MPVRVVAVEDEVACELDLVRRVVREVPGRGRVAQADLEQDGGNEEHRADERREPDAGPSRPGAEPPGGCGGEGDDEPGEHRHGANDAEIPFLLGGADERRENALRVDQRRVERPRVRAQARHRHDHEHAKDAEQHPNGVLL